MGRILSNAGLVMNSQDAIITPSFTHNGKCCCGGSTTCAQCESHGTSTIAVDFSGIISCSGCSDPGSFNGIYDTNLSPSNCQATLFSNAKCGSFYDVVVTFSDAGSQITVSFQGSSFPLPSAFIGAIPYSDPSVISWCTTGSGSVTIANTLTSSASCTPPFSTGGYGGTATLTWV